jgi:hypothetical protein
MGLEAKTTTAGRFAVLPSMGRQKSSRIRSHTSLRERFAETKLKRRVDAGAGVARYF